MDKSDPILYGLVRRPFPPLPEATPETTAQLVEHLKGRLANLGIIGATGLEKSPVGEVIALIIPDSTK